MQSEIHLRLKDLVSTPAQPEKIHVYKSGLSKGMTKKIRAHPARRGLIGVGKTTLWRWVKEGVFPQPIRLSDGVTVWRLSDVQKWLEEKAHHPVVEE